MTVYLSNRDGNGKTNEEGHLRLLSKVLQGEVLTSTDLQVTQNSPLGLNVIVKKGDYRLETSGGTYAYMGWIDADTVVNITSPDGSNPRITSVIIYVDKGAATSASPPNNPGVAKLVTVNGSASSSPVAPSGTTIQTAVGAGNPYMILANVAVGAGVTQITNSDITDFRDKIQLNTSILSAPLILQLVGPLIYPLGSIYSNATDNTNPSSLLGFGTWTRIGNGRVLVGVNEGDPDFGAPGSIGGVSSVTLTEAQMPAHNHNGSTDAAGQHQHVYYRTANQIIKRIQGNADNMHGFNDGGYNDLTSGAGNHAHSFTTSTRGSSQAHTNLQPYTTVYMWRRTA